MVGSQGGREEVIFGAAFDGHVIRRFLQFVAPYRRKLYLAIAAVLVFSATQIAIPLMIRRAIDDVLFAATALQRVLVATVLVFGAIVCVNYIANLLQESIAARTGEHVLFDLRRAMYNHLQHVSLSFMDKTETGRLMSRLQGDVYALQEFLESSIFAIGDIVLLIGIMVVLSLLDLQLGLLTMAVVPTLFLVRFAWLPFARKAFLRARETSSILNGALAEGINGVRTVQSMGREALNFDLFSDKAKENLAAQLKATRFSQIMIPIVDTLTGVSMGIVILAGGAHVLRNTLDIGVMVAFLFYVQRFFAPIRSVTLQYSVMQRAMASGQRIFEVMDIPLGVEDKPDARPLIENDGSIEFKNVTFGYLRDQPVLNNISFKVNPGETVALVGPTGSGKTSITALVHRFYDVWAGNVLVGERDVRDVTQASLGEQIGMVLQEPFLFSGSIADNIRYCTREATVEQIQEAAKAVGAHDFISRLPQGYATVMEERGGNLSLGQRQLVSFARAIVANTKVLVLDEATANIDSYTERQIQQALAKLLHGRTGIVIAHRLATIRGADRILVLQEGSIIERGTHDELMAVGGLYARLYSMNYASFDDIPDEMVQAAITETGAS